MLAAAEQFLEQQMHPTVIIRQYKQALEDIITLLEGPLSVPVDKNNKTALASVVSSLQANVLKSFSAESKSLKKYKMFYLKYGSYQLLLV